MKKQPILIMGMVIAIVMVVVLLTLPNSTAHALSASCAAPPAPQVYGTGGVGTSIGTFEAGEQVTLTVAGNPAGANWASDAAFATSANFNPSVTITIPSGGLTIWIYSDMANFGVADADEVVTVGCSLPGAGGGAEGIPSVFPGDGDADGDTVINRIDNCPFNKNPDQANNWGSLFGDVCDQEYFDSGTGVKIFQQLNSLFKVFGNCSGNQCEEIAIIDPRALSPEGGPFRFEVTNSGGWFVLVHFESFGSQIYRVEVFDGGGTIRSAALRIVVNNNRTVSWRVGSGSSSVARSGGANATVIDNTAIVQPVGSSTEGEVASGPVQPGQAGQAGDGLVVRTEPRENAIRLVKTISYGETVQVIQADESGTWFLVNSASGLRGWVPSEWILPLGSIGEIVPPAPPVANSAVRPGNEAVVTAGVYMRSAPNDGAGRTFLLPQGLVVRIVSEDDSTYWYEVEANGVRGWANSLSFGPVGSAGRLTPSVATDVKVGDTAVTVQETSARTNPGGDVAFVLPRGTQVQVGAVQSGFIQVTFTGGSGWLPFGTLAVFNPLAPVPVESAPAAAAPAAAAPAAAAPAAAAPAAAAPAAAAPAAAAPAAAAPAAAAPTATPVPTVPPAPTPFTANGRVRPGQCAAAIGTVNVRVEPDLNSALVGQIVWGARVDVLAEDASGFWFQIRAEGTVTDADGNKSQQVITGWAANEWFGRPGDFIERGGGTVPNVCG